jgi:hypothetical protein
VLSGKGAAVCIACGWQGQVGQGSTLMMLLKVAGLNKQQDPGDVCVLESPVLTAGLTILFLDVLDSEHTQLCILLASRQVSCRPSAGTAKCAGVGR